MVQLFEDQYKREMFWKGVIIEKLITSINLKRQVQGILNHCNLPKNITLRQFYDACPNQWLFTVTAVDISSKKIVFINKNTYPFMPVWAALVITSSLPTLFTPIKARSQWLQSYDRSTNQRKFDFFFRDNKQHLQPQIFVSGNLIASIPLEFLTSKKCNQLYFKLKECTFMNFSIEKKPINQPSDLYFKRHFFSACDALKFGLSSIFQPKKEWTKNFSSLQHKFQVLKSFLRCHDHLVQDMYYENILKLPIYLSTLEFHKIKQQFLHSTIQQAYFTTLEKFSKFKKKISQNRREIAERQTFIRFQKVKKQKSKQNSIKFYETLTDQSNNLNQDSLMIRFLSKARSNKEAQTKYKIFYCEFQQDIPCKQKIQLYGDVLILSKNSIGIEITFIFVDQKNQYHRLVQSIYKITFKNLLLNVNFELYSPVYQIYYNRAVKAELQPLNLPINQVKNSTIYCDTVLSLRKNGLFCQQCGENLNPCNDYSFSNIYLPKPTKPIKCNKCQKFSTKSKLKCSKCPQCYYCFQCLKGNLMELSFNRLVCMRKHMFQFKDLSEDLKLFQCDICDQISYSICRDRICQIVICNKCCQQFVTQS